MRFVAFAILFLAPALGAPKQHSTSPATSKPTEVANLCKPEFLPKDIQSHLKEQYSSWKVQEPDNLNSNARERWESEIPLQCPGIAIGHFDSPRTVSYALLLHPQSRSVAGYKFLVFSPKLGQQSYGMNVLDQADKEGSGNYFIHTVAFSKFFDGKSREKFQLQTDEAIIFVDSGENEYESDVYFFAKSGYMHQPVDY